jgi:hypothetical protein
MLYNLALGFGLALIAAGFAATFAGAPGAAIGGLFVAGMLLTFGVIYERVQYKPILDRLPSGNWQDTGERFIDPSTRQTVTIYADPRTGKRIYIGGEVRSDAD